MRPKRKRTAVKRDDDFVDVDSDELAQLIEEDGPPSRKQRANNSRGTKKGPARSASEPAAAAADDEDYIPDESEAAAASGLLKGSATESDSKDATAAAAAAAGGGLSEPDSQADDNSSSSGDEYHSAESDVDTDGSDADYDDSGSSGKAKGKQQDASKLKAKQQKEKPPKKKRKSNRRLCATYAKAQFGLSDKDLGQLTDVEYKPNPYYRSAGPMRLYLVRELEELAAAKAERIKRAPQAREERAAEARTRKAAAAAEAARKAQAFVVHTPKGDKHGSVVLPDTCLVCVMEAVAGTLEPGGLRGPSAVTADLGRLSLVCWDFYHASKAGFLALAAAAADIHTKAPDTYYNKPTATLLNLGGPQALGGWAFWDQALQNPGQLKLPALKDAARQLGLQVTGTKAELMLRVLGAFRLAAPTTAPAQLLRALLLERGLADEHYPTAAVSFVWDGDAAAGVAQEFRSLMGKLQQTGDARVRELQAAQQQRGAAGVRATLLDQGYASLQDFMTAGKALYEAYQDEQRSRMHEQQIARERQRQERLAAAAAAANGHARPQWGPAAAAAAAAAGGLGMLGHGSVCACGNQAAQACARSCCGKCCHAAAGRGGGAVRCARHRN